MILTFVDTSGVQSYIFGSNRLRENIGASYLVKCATGPWAETAAVTASHGKARTLYAGGGNFAVCFDTQPEADAFERELTRKAILEAPGLNLIVAHEPFDFAADSMAKTVFPAIQKRIDGMKRTRVRTSPALGYGITRACRSTGLAAVGFRPEPGSKRLIEASAEVLAKENAADNADDDLKDKFVAREYSFPKDLDKLGRTIEEQSYIAIVHADGNAMGKQLQKIADHYPKPDQNDAYLDALKKFSDAVNDAGIAAMKRTISDLVDAVTTPEGGCAGIYYSERLQIKLVREGHGAQHREYLPLRPLVYGGDDITFVCDGRVGISLATLYLKYFEEETNQPERKALIGDQLTACAGIAIVKSHHPFARAYAMAGELCKSAKEFRKKTDRPLGSCLDWHFGLSGLSSAIKEIRDTEYTVSAGSLHQRPVSLVPSTQRYRSWKEVEATTRHFQMDVDWSEKRNKMKALREELRGGAEAVAKFRILYQLKKELAPDNPQDGWDKAQCTLFDAIELADIFIQVPLP